MKCEPKKNIRNNGYTLIELCVTTLALVTLASVAFPLYSGIQERAKAASIISSTQNFAKDCLIKFVSSNTSPLEVPSSITLTSPTETDCSSGSTLKNSNPFNGNLIHGIKCGQDTQDANTETFCTFTILDSKITGSWGSS